MRFFGAQPISIERKHLGLLIKNRYKVCEKTDGTRSFLVSDETGVWLLNRAMKKTPFEGFRLAKESILDGEITQDGSFIVHDAMVIGGSDISQLNLDERIKLYTAFIRSCPKVIGKIKIKQHRDLKDISEIDPMAPGIDGLIFTPIDEPVRVGTHETLFKWKPTELNTVDFVYKEGYLCIQGPKYIQKATFQAPEHSIIECKFENGVWLPVKTRTDKNYPNNLRTYQRTLVNIREDIKFSDIIQLVHGAKKGSPHESNTVSRVS